MVARGVPATHRRRRRLVIPRFSTHRADARVREMQEVSSIFPQLADDLSSSIKITVSLLSFSVILSEGEGEAFFFRGACAELESKDLLLFP